MIFLAVLFLIFVLVIFWGVSNEFFLVSKGGISRKSDYVQIGLIMCYIICWIVFLFGYLSNTAEYYQRIDPVENDYSPLAGKHSLSFWVFMVLSFIGIIRLWTKGKNQPPLLLVLFLSWIIIGIVLNSVLIAQLAFRFDPVGNSNDDSGLFMIFMPIFNVCFSIALIIQSIRYESDLSVERSYKNKFLNLLNQKIQKTTFMPGWALLAAFPVYLVITLILMLFGQDYNALSKVFTETATWQLSQQLHPPYLDHRGHYLCTVAACGSPRIVKPLRIGTRHGTQIIVNRQLQVANAFEAVIERKIPEIHRLIRKNYDKYGFPLSKRITTPFKSDLTYLLMKPIEWLFIVFIYLTVVKPEELIREQYKMNSENS